MAIDLGVEVTLALPGHLLVFVHHYFTFHVSGDLI